TRRTSRLLAARSEFEASQRGCLIVEHFERRLQFQYSEEPMTLCVEAQDPDVAAALSDVLEHRGHHADAGTVDVGDRGKIHDDLDYASGSEIVDPPSECKITIVERDLAVQRQHDDCAGMAFDNLQCGVAHDYLTL